MDKHVGEYCHLEVGAKQVIASLEKELEALKGSVSQDRQLYPIQNLILRPENVPPHLTSSI